MDPAAHAFAPFATHAALAKSSRPHDVRCTRKRGGDSPGAWRTGRGPDRWVAAAEKTRRSGDHRPPVSGKTDARAVETPIASRRLGLHSQSAWAGDHRKQRRMKRNGGRQATHLVGWESEVVREKVTVRLRSESFFCRSRRFHFRDWKAVMRPTLLAFRASAIPAQFLDGNLHSGCNSFFGNQVPVNTPLRLHLRSRVALGDAWGDSRHGIMTRV